MSEVNITRRRDLPTRVRSLAPVRPRRDHAPVAVSEEITADAPDSLWRNRDFVVLWAGDTISQFGTQFTQLAVPLTAVLTLGATPLDVGLLEAAGFLPFLLIGLPAGVWVDRVRRRPVMILADLGRVLALATIPLAAAFWTLTLVHLIAVVVAVGVCTVFFDVAYAGLLPGLVQRKQLPDANGKLQASQSAGQVAGPGLAGAVVGAFGAPAALGIDAASFAVSAAALLGLRNREPKPERRPKSERSMRRELGEGIRYLWGHPLLRPIASCTATFNFAGGISGAVLTIFQVRTLGLSPTAIGLIFAVANIGTLLGALVATRLAKALGIGRAIVLASVCSGLGGIGVPLATRSTAVPVLVASSALIGFGAVAYNVNQVSLRQSITPDRMLGRMTATVRFVVLGVLPIGAVLGGVTGGLLGVRNTLWISAGIAAVSVVWVMLSPVARLTTVPEPIDPDDLVPPTPVAALPGLSTDETRGAG
jgi:MFS family permease